MPYMNFSLSPLKLGIISMNSFSAKNSLSAGTQFLVVKFILRVDLILNLGNLGYSKLAAIRIIVLNANLSHHATLLSKN